MAVAVFSSAAVVSVGVLAVDDGGEGPEPAGRGEPVVLDLAVGDRDRSSGGLGDGCGSGVCLDGSGVAEPSAVVAHLSQDLGASAVAEAREAGDDRVVGVLGEGLGGGLTEFVDVAAFDVEGGQERRGLPAECLLEGSGCLSCGWRSAA